MRPHTPKIDVRVEPVGFEKGSSLHIVTVNGKDHCCFVADTALSARIDANGYARHLALELERKAYDEEDERRKILGRTRVARPNT